MYFRFKAIGVFRGTKLAPFSQGMSGPSPLTPLARAMQEKILYFRSFAAVFSLSSLPQELLLGWKEYTLNPISTILKPADGK